MGYGAGQRLSNAGIARGGHHPLWGENSALGASHISAYAPVYTALRHATAQEESTTKILEYITPNRVKRRQPYVCAWRHRRMNTGAYGAIYTPIAYDIEKHTGSYAAI